MDQTTRLAKNHLAAGNNPSAGITTSFFNKSFHLLADGLKPVY